MRMSKHSSCLIHRNFLVGISYSDATPGQSFAYDHLENLTQITDVAGTRTFAYNPYGELETDNLRVGNHTHLITEKKDAFGRSTGYIYARSGAAQHTVSIGYGEDGRIATAGFLQGSAPQTFTWQYMEGSGLPSVMAMPNGMTLEWGYEEKRDLVATMVYKRGATRVVEREYAYDSLARPVTRRTARQGNTVNVQQPERTDRRRQRQDIRLQLRQHRQPENREGRHGRSDRLHNRPAQPIHSHRARRRSRL